MANFEIAVNKTFKFEGGFQQYANDSANWLFGVLIGTNHGISAQAYYTAFGKIPSVQDMKNLTLAIAKNIYKLNYWNKLNLDKINNQSVAELMFQYIIGSGLSQISNIKSIANEVGSLGISETDATLTDSQAVMINNLNQKQFHAALWQWRYDFFDRLVASNPSKYSMFLNGWRIRLKKHVYKDEGSNLKSILTPILMLFFLFLIYRMTR